MENLYSENGQMSFEKCLAWMERKGKELYGEHFNIHYQDHELLFKLLIYVIRDKENAGRLNIQLNKGILLSGPVGCGKTSLMSILRFFLPNDSWYMMKSCRDVSFEFIQEGYAVIIRYSRNSFSHEKPRVYCFDDLGTENNLKYYGNECNVMSEILLSRYDSFVSNQMITHITTNLNSSEIESLYGIRVRSRMREMFNLISFEKEAKDKRI
jgi:DNA replication protein DnaC